MELESKYEDPFDNNASKKQLRQDKIFSFIYIIRSHIPSNMIFYLLFFFFKYNSTYLATNNVTGKEDGYFTAYKVLKAITFFGNGYCMFKNNYCYVCVGLFAFMLAFIIIVAVIFKQYMRSDSCKTFVIVMTYLFIFFSFFSQYMCEILIPGIFAYTLTSTKSVKNEGCKDEFLSYLVNEEAMPRYVITILNIVSFVLLNGLLYCFLLFINSPTRSFVHGNLNFNYKKIFNPAFIMYSFQGFITSSNLYNEQARQIIRLAFCIAAVVLSSFSAIGRNHKFNYYEINFPLQYTVFATYMCIIGGGIEILLYIFFTGDLTQLYYYLKIGVMGINSILLTYYYLVGANIFFTNELIAKIFIDKNKMSHDDLAKYDIMLFNYLNDKCDFSELYHILHTHKVKCQVPKCPCKILEIDKWVDKDAITEDNEHYLIVKMTKKIEEFKMSSIKDFIEIAEYEMRKNILLLRKDTHKDNFKQDLLILLHLDIVYILKRDNSIAMYFCDRYRQMCKNINFMTRYYLYEYKILISRELANVDKISSIDRELNEKREMTRQMKEFYRYAEFMEKVKKMIINCIFALETILKYKRKQSMKNLTIANLISCDQFLKISSQIRSTNRKLSRSIKDYLKTKEPDNPELCILVCYYYLMLSQKAPKKMVRKLEEIMRKGNNDDDDYISQLAYDNINISNPMIVILNRDDNFIIVHITMKMCSIIKEGRREILKNDLHNYLPKDIIKMHKIIMKQFLLTSSSQFIKDTFILDHNNCLVPMKIICNPLNTLETNFGLVINFIENEKNSMFNDYYFMLNNEFHFLGINELFTQEYFFNMQMMKMIHLDFCTFFGIKADKINLKLRNYFKKNKLNNVDELIEECNKEMSIFTVNTMENLFNQDKLNINKKKLALKLKERIHKKDIINNLTHLQKNINDFGLDLEWYNRIGFFRDRLLIGINNDDQNDNDKGKEQSFLNYFEAYYTINSIGNFYYIIVNLRESLNNTGDDVKRKTIHVNQMSVKTGDLTPYGPGGNSGFGNLDDENAKALADSKHVVFKDTPGNNSITNEINLGDKSSDLSGSMVKMVNNNENKLKMLGPRSETAKSKRERKKKEQKKQEETPKDDTLIVEERTAFQNRQVYTLLDYVWRFFIALQIGFCFLWVIFNQNDYNTAFDLYYINLYSTNIQTDIFYASLSLFAKCGIYGQLDDKQMDEETDKLRVVADELRSDSKNFITYLNYQIKKSELITIFEVLNEIITFNVMLVNREQINRQNSFYDELSFYQNKIFNFAYHGDFSACSLANYENDTTASPELREIYYIVNNVPKLIAKKFDEVNNVAFNIFENYLIKSKKFSVIFILMSIAMEVILMIIMQFIMSDHKANTQILLNTIYTPHKNDHMFEEDLYNYKELLYNFTKESYIHFRSMHSQITCDENSSTDRSRKTDNQNNLNDESNNISGDKKSKFTIYKFSDNSTIPKHYFITMFGMYVSGIVFILLEVIHLYSNLNFYDKFSKSNSISLNFVSLIPKLVELLSYTRISIFLNDKDLLTVELDEYESKNIYQYYDFNVLEEMQNIIDKYKNSQFSYLYYQYTLIKKNIKTFTYEKSDALETTQNWENLFQAPESSFCIYSSLGYLYSTENPDMEYLDIFSKMAERAAECKVYGEGFNLHNLDTILGASLLQIETLYGDFVSPNRDKTAQAYLENQDLYLIENNLKGQLKYIYTTYVTLTKQDISELIVTAKIIEIVFAIFLCLSALLYTVIVFLLLGSSNSNLTILIYIRAFMYQALNSKGRSE